MAGTKRDLVIRGDDVGVEPKGIAGDPPPKTHAWNSMQPAWCCFAGPDGVKFRPGRLDLLSTNPYSDPISALQCRDAWARRRFGYEC